MSEKTKAKKIVRITEENLVKLLEGIVNDAVTEKKKEWIAEQDAKNGDLIKEQVDRYLAEKFGKK